MSGTLPALERIRAILSFPGDRIGKARRIAAAIRGAGPYRWAGIYDVTPGGIALIAWDGPGPPDHPRYLATLGTTRAEIVVPVLGSDGAAVRGRIHVESERADAFGAEDRQLLEECAAALLPLWE